MMSESNPQTPDEIPQIQLQLRQLAMSLREASHLDPQAKQSLAALLEELGAELDPTGSISAPTAHLTDAVSNVVRALHESHSPGLLQVANDRLKQAALRAETEAPGLTGIAYRFLDMLASLGI